MLVFKAPYHGAPAFRIPFRNAHDGDRNEDRRSHKKHTTQPPGYFQSHPMKLSLLSGRSSSIKNRRWLHVWSNSSYLIVPDPARTDQGGLEYSDLIPLAKEGC